MTTGEGGCVSTRDAELAKIVGLLRFHGMDREAWNRYGKTALKIMKSYAGLQYNMMTFKPPWAFINYKNWTPSSSAALN